MYTIAIDKEIINKIKIKPNIEYIYLFNDESLEELIATNLKCVSYKNFNYADINLTKYDIECIKKASIEDKDYDVLPDKVNYKIGIIVPNYNYEYTIEKCLKSIFNQTYQNFEIIFIDDCSTDKSLEIAKKFLTIYTSNQLKIVPLKQKRYNGGARNEAYLHLSNDVDYIWYVDSDDWLLEDTSLEKINKRLQSYPDVLFVGISTYMNRKTEVCKIPEYSNKYDAIRGWSGSCGKVIKKELATKQENLYNEGTLKEDKNHHCRICINMKSFNCLKESVYVWNRENPNSVTTKRDNPLWQTSTIRHYADAKLLYMTYKGKDKEIDNYLEERLNQIEVEIKNNGDRQY